MKSTNGFLVLAFFLFSSGTMNAQMEVSTNKIILGESVTVILEQAQETLIVEYRPSSNIVTRDTLVSATPTRNFEWTPKKPGVVRLNTRGGSKNVSVRFRGLSVNGLLVMLLAGVILFGGAGLAFRSLMAK